MLKQCVRGVLISAGIFFGQSNAYSQATVLEASTGSSVSSATRVATSSQSELVILIEQMQNEIRTLRGEIEALQNRVSKNETDNANRYLDTDRRLSLLMQNMLDDEPSVSSPIINSEEPANDSSSINTTEEIAADVSESAEEKETLVDIELPENNEREAYQLAFSLVRDREFASAIIAFNQHVELYPSHSTTANGYYWLGELYLAENQLEEARKSFETVMTNFPGHSKVPDTLYKLGVTHFRMGNIPRAKEFMQLAMTEYPQSGAAALANNFITQNITP